MRLFRLQAPAPGSIQGFTLVELMITVAIIGILAGVALPNYSDYLRRGKLPEATSALSDYRVKMEQFYQDNRNYGSESCADTGSPAWNNFSPAGRKNFSYACSLTDGGQGYVVTATGTGTVAGHVYTVTGAGAMATTKFKNAEVSNRNCWLQRGDEC